MKFSIISLLLLTLSLVTLYPQDEALTIDENGNVGINNSAPTTTLDVNGNIKATNIEATADIAAVNITATGAITAPSFQFANGSNLIQFVQYWRLNDAYTLSTYWQSINSSNNIKVTMSDLFPGYVDNEKTGSFPGVQPTTDSPAGPNRHALGRRSEPVQQFLLYEPVWPW